MVPPVVLLPIASARVALGAFGPRDIASCGYRTNSLLCPYTSPIRGGDEEIRNLSGTILHDQRCTSITTVPRKIAGASRNQVNPSGGTARRASGRRNTFVANSRVLAIVRNSFP